MPFCNHCGKELPENARYCPHCGASQYLSSSPRPILSSISNAEFARFIGPNAAYYMIRFQKFPLPAGGQRFQFTWNWAAFFFGPIWMLYRRLYLWALLTFIVEWIPGLNLLVWITVGCTANYLYFRHAQGKILELKRLFEGPELLLDHLPQSGGVSPLAAVVGIVFWLLVLGGILCTWVLKTLT